MTISTLSVIYKKCNVHTIPVFIYKQISGIIGGVLSKLINLSFSSGVFPSLKLLELFLCLNLEINIKRKVLGLYPFCIS